MKIGLLTYHRAINYGAILQAYSLNKIMTDLNHEVEVIDYYPAHDEVDYNIFRSLSSSKNWIYNLLVLPFAKKTKTKKTRFVEFQKQHLKLSRRYYSCSELKQTNLQYDAIISGSDQVFNPVNDEMINTYYLNFASENTRKIAYAPSFGISQFTVELADKLKPFLDKFQDLSCREIDGSKFIANTCGKKCPTVIDPVFLTSMDDWKRLAGCNIKEGGYIFIYDLNGRERLIALANRLKKKTGLPIICLSTKKYFTKKYDVDQLVLDAGPIEFLKYISEASYILTDSFHGTSFSLLFGKKFLSCIALQKSSARLESLLSCVNLLHHLVQLNDAQSFNSDVVFEDYDSGNMLQNQIDYSLEYLKNSLK